MIVQAVSCIKKLANRSVDPILRESATGMPAVRMSHPLRRICICGPDPDRDSHSHGRALHPSPGGGRPWHASSGHSPVVRNAQGPSGPSDIRTGAPVTMPSRPTHPDRRPIPPGHADRPSGDRACRGKGYQPSPANPAARRDRHPGHRRHRRSAASGGCMGLGDAMSMPTIQRPKRLRRYHRCADRPAISNAPSPIPLHLAGGPMGRRPPVPRAPAQGDAGS